MSTMSGRSMRIGQCLSLAVALYAFAACSDDSGGGGTGGGSGGTNPQGQGGTNPQGQGGTNPQGQGGTNPQGQGGTNPQGQGGTNPQGQGGTEPHGTAGESGSAGAAGDAGAAGAAGASSTCTTESGYECPPCDEGYVHVDCGGKHCICETVDGRLKSGYEALLACGLDEPCPVSTQQSDVVLRSWENGECLLEALRDRTPGKYQLARRGGIDGIEYSDIVIILDGSDEVVVSDMQTGGLAAGNLRRQYISGACTLKSTEELDACVAAGTDPDDDGICADLSDWTETCEVLQDPQCPSE